MRPAQIAKYLGLSVSTVWFWINREKETGDVQEEDIPGRPRCTTTQQDQQMINMAEADRPKTTQEIADHMAQKGVTLSRTTVGRRLHEDDLYYGNTTKKPLLTDRHIENRLQFAQDHQYRNWCRTIYSDESSFLLNYTKGRVWKRRGEFKLSRTVKHCVRVNLWGCFSFLGFGELVTVKGILESKQMCVIYDKGLLTSADKFFGVGNRDWQLIEDGDSKHTSKLCRAWKADHGVEVIDWPANSPDLNPMENVWAVLKDRLRKRRYSSLIGFKRCISEEWKKLSVEYAQNLSLSMTRRCQAVIAQAGEWTLY
jgi:transposase